MSDSTRRALRTAYQLTIALTIALPLILLGLPPEIGHSASVAGLVALTAGVTKAINALEDRGLIPAWLKG